MQSSVTVQSPPISRSRAWLLAIRPKTLPAAVGPVLVGAALAFADGHFALRPALAALLTALLLQIGSNLANDYFDFVHGADNVDRLGPVRVAASGLISPQELRAGMWVVFGAATLMGCYLVFVGGWPILIAGVASILAALAYTGGPFPFGYYGLGDLFVFIFFGLVAVCGTYYVQALALTWEVALAAVPVGALITAILVVNNLRDIDTDRRAGKRTLAVLMGRRATQAEYVALAAIAYGATLLLWFAGDRSPWLLLPWLSLPLTVRLVRTVLTASSGATLNAALAATARLSLIFSLLLAIGVIL